MELSERITDLQKVIYGLAVEKNKLDKQARYLVEEIGAEKKRIAEAEHRRLAEAIHLIEKELLALSSNDGTNKELIHKKEMERKVLMDKYATVWSDSVNLVSDDLITLQNSLEEAENRLQQIETEGRAITMNLMSLEEEQKNMEMTNESEKKTDPHKTEDYMFIPTIDKDGIIDYTSVESDKIYLANRKTILSQDYPSYLPPVQIRRNTQYDIPAYKINDNEYLLRESRNPHKDDNGNIIEPKIYRVSLDVYAALINYHLEFDRAAFNAVAKRNEEERLKAVDSGITEYQAIRESSIPELAGKLDVNGLNETYTTRRLDYIYKPSRVALQSVKSRRMNHEPYYFIESMAKKEGKHLSRNEIFQVHRECINNVNQKILDMELQKADFESSWTKGRDTSYGDSNLDLSLLDTHGIRVKRQNGDIITRKEIDEISEAITQVHRMYGDVSQVARNFGLKVSHAGNMKMHASKASGIFTSYQNAIGISFGNGMLQASIIACHEYTHFLDHLSGKERHAWHASDIPGTLENEIAVAFREHMNPVSGDYWNRTCECFARAMEEYAHINILRKANEKPGQTILSDEEINAEISKPAYVPYSAFLKHIVPLADRLIEYYQEKFNINTITQAPVIEQEQESPATSYSLQENTRDLPNLNANYTQLELFETATEYNSKEHSFFSQLDQYLENGITPRGNIFTLHSTPDILQYGNLTNNPIIIRVAILKKALVKHSLTKDEIRMALRSLSDPVLLFDTNKDASEAKGESVLLLTDSISRNQNSVAIALELNKDSNGQFIHEIRSIHERVLIARNGSYVLDEWIEKGLLKYIDDKKISGWQRRERVYFPMSFAQPDINNLLQDSSFVNKISGENIKSKSLYINALISDHPETYIKEGDAALTREHIRSSKAALRSYTDPVLKGPRNGLWKVFRDFKKHGIFDIQGTQIETTSKGQITSEGWKQLYQATSIYRDKRFETFRMLFVTQDGIVKDQIAISSNLPDRVRVVSLGTVLRNDIFEHATRTNTKIVLVHNHPSGNIEPSDADTYITRQFYEVFQGESQFHPSREAISLNYPPEIAEHMLAGIEESSLVMGHIILDHDSFSLWEPENGWNTIEYLKNNHDPLMKTRNPMFTNFRITGKQALCNAARAINESDRWNSSDWIPVIFTNSSTTINSIRYYSKDWFKRTSSREIQDEFISIGKRTGTVRAFPLLNEEFAGDTGLRECILNHFYNGCFTDYFFAGETAAGTDVFRYGKGIFDSLRDDDISRTDQIDSTITLPFLEERKDDNREQSIVAEAMLHSRPNYKEGMLQYVNDKEKAVELTSTLQVRVKANSIAFNENIHRKSEFVKQCYIRSPQDIYTQNNDQNAVKKEANMEGLEVKDGLAHEGEKRKPYFQLNAEMLLDSIKTEKAPFLAKNVETPTVTLNTRNEGVERMDLIEPGKVNDSAAAKEVNDSVKDFYDAIGLDYNGSKPDPRVDYFKDFYKSIAVDPNEPLLAEGKSLNSTILSFENTEKWAGEGRYYERDAATVLALGYFDESGSMKPKGLDEFLASNNFDLDNPEVAKALSRVKYERRVFLKQNAIREANMEGLEVKDGLAHEGEKRKPYFQLNAEMLLDSIKTEKAPFLAKNVETPTVTLMPQAIRSAATGRTFRGMNQILAQISLKEMGSRDTEIITYKQAKKFEAGIKKGSKGLHLTSYDAEGKKQTAYKYYPFSATYDRDNLPKIPEHTKKPNTVIFANEADPQKYLGKYLAATSLGAKFVTTPETMESFRKRVVEDLEKSFSENRHSKIFELGNKASEICRETMSEIGTRDHTMSRINDSRRNTTMNTTEPYNPVTGEKFLGENAGKAAYLMERRKSKDPRFLEITDLLKAGLSLKEDAKEVLTVSSDGKTRFFYNAIDIEGMPPRNNVQNRAQKQFVANQKQKDLDMSM